MSAARHILFINEFYHPDFCASAVVATDHLSRIAGLRPDWRITVLAGNRAWHDPSLVYPPHEEHRGVSIVRVERPPVSRTSLLRRGWGFVSFGRAVLREARRLGRIDLVVGTTAPPQGGRIAARIARRPGCPYIYKVLDLYPDLGVSVRRIGPRSIARKLWLAADARTMSRAAAVVTVSQRMAARIARTRSGPPAALTAIYDGFDARRLVRHEPNPFREAHNKDGRFVVQYAGNMGLSHPLGTILGAAARLSSDPTILFQFVGDGPRRGEVARALGPRAQLLPYQPAENLGDLLDTADVCLISQHADVFDQALPYKIYAILAAGRPTIFVGHRSSEIAEWLTEHGAGAHVDQGDLPALVSTILSIKNDVQRRRSMGEAAVRLFRERFDSAFAAERWVRLMDTILSRQA